MGKWLLALALLLGGAFTPIGCANPQHCRANYELVQIGMTRDQVFMILGKPFRHEADEDEYWGPEGRFEIEYDDNGLVKEKDWD